MNLEVTMRVMRISFNIVIVLITGLMSFSIANAQSEKDAYKALKKVEIQFQSGIKYDSFKEAYVDAKLEVEMFINSPDASKTPSFTEHMKRALLAYDGVNEMWGYKLNHPRNSRYTTKCNKYLALDIKYLLTAEELKLYGGYFDSLNAPQNKMKSGPSEEVSGCPDYPEFSQVSRDIAIQILMKEASKELELAYTALVQKIDKPPELSTKQNNASPKKTSSKKNGAK